MWYIYIYLYVYADTYLWNLFVHEIPVFFLLFFFVILTIAEPSLYSICKTKVGACFVPVAGVASESSGRRCDSLTREPFVAGGHFQGSTPLRRSGIVGGHGKTLRCSCYETPGVVAILEVTLPLGPVFISPWVWSARVPSQENAFLASNREKNQATNAGQSENEAFVSQCFTQIDTDKNSLKQHIINTVDLC